LFVGECIVFGNKSLYCILLYAILGALKMNRTAKTDEIRWQVIKAMLEEFPSLKMCVQKYLKEKKKRRMQSKSARNLKNKEAKNENANC
jgi:hypothetical protein